MKTSLLILFSILVLSGCAPDRVTHNIVSSKKPGSLIRYNPVAVLGFTEPSGNNRYYDAHGSSKVIEQYFETYLSQVGFRVVERNQIARMLNEQIFQYSGLTDGQLIRLGKVAGVKSIITGAIISYYVANPCCDSNVIFTTKMIDVESGNILFSSVSKLERDLYGGKPDEIANFLVYNTVRKMMSQ